MKNNNIYINGRLLKEQYITDKKNIHYLNAVFDVPQNKIFVMGDNRNYSEDSRNFKCINMNNITGKVFFTFYPFKRITIH